MRIFHRYLSIFLVGFVILILVLEELNIGTGYIYFVNQYDEEVLKPITVRRDDKSKSIGIVIVIGSAKDEEKYEMALDTVRCYARHFEYDLHVIHVEDEKVIGRKCRHRDFMFRRHCVLSLKLTELFNSWLLFLDADMGIINPNHLLESFLPEDQKTQIVFYDRIMNQEVMAGSYLVRNSQWSRDFLMFWANYEYKLPKSFHGSDNGAIHSVILEYTSLKKEKEFCEQRFWQISRDYEDLSTYEVCAQKLIKSTNVPEIKILEKGRFAWARDGWLTGSVWSDRDFIFHGWQKKRKDKMTFAMWHSPLVYELPFNLTKCSTEKMFENWRYKNTFIGSVVDVDRQILGAIEKHQLEFEQISKIISTTKV